MASRERSNFGRFIRLLIALVCLTGVYATRAMALPSDRTVVSLGDSYSAGEGCPPFYGQYGNKGTGEDKYASEDWLAHRSTHSWPGQIQVGGVTMNEVKCSQTDGVKEPSEGTRWYFYACSGAEAHHVFLNSYLKEGVRQDNLKKFNGEVRQQLEEAKADIGKENLDDVDYVTMSVGGNDIGFRSIVIQVAIRQGFIDRDYLFNALNKAWYKFDRSTPYVGTEKNLIHAFEDDNGSDNPKRNEIRDCYRSILDTFKNAHVVVAGYPPLMDDDEFQGALDRSGGSLWDRFLSFFSVSADRYYKAVGFASWEGWFIDRSIHEFNASLRGLTNEVDSERIHFVDVEDTFDGHEANAKNEGTRFLNGIMPIQSEDFEQLKFDDFEPSFGKGDDTKYPLFPVSSYSMHPNYKEFSVDGMPINGEGPHDGISAYRICVQKAINELESKRLSKLSSEEQSEDDTDTVVNGNSHSDGNGVLNSFVVVYNDRLYYKVDGRSKDDSASIRSCALDGTDKQTVVESVGMWGIRTLAGCNEGHLVFAGPRYYGVWSVKTDGSELTQIADGSASIFVQDASHVAEGSVIYACDSDFKGSGSWELRSCAPDGDGDQLIFKAESDEYNPNVASAKPFGASQGNLFYIKSRGYSGKRPDDVGVYKIGVGGGNPAQIVSGADGGACVVGDGIFAITDGVLRRYSFDGKDTEGVIWQTDGFARLLNATDRYVFIDPPVLGGGIIRLDLSSGKEDVLTVSSEHGDIDVINNVAYIQTGEGIVSYDLSNDTMSLIVEW